MSWLYYIFITPIEYLIEIVFTITNRFFGNPGWALVFFCVIVSTLTLPLYLRADAVQHREKQSQVRMSKWIDHIKHVFTGDERYLIMNAYYKEQGYHPLNTLRGMVPLFLQIPFFIAAYRFISGLDVINDCSFGIIRDLGVEDGLISIGSFSINVLPVLMTLINLTTAFIYTKGLSAKEKIQPVVLALIFLVLLYHSPSGLVLYWTLNNVYSLIKNIIMERSKCPIKVAIGICTGAGILYTVYVFVSGKLLNALQLKDYESVLIYFFVPAAIGVVILYLLFRLKKAPNKNTSDENTSNINISDKKTSDQKASYNKALDRAVGTDINDKWLLPVESAVLCVIFGLMVPLSVMSASPQEFMAADRDMSPWIYIIYTLAVSVGIFAVWLGIFYKLTDKKEGFHKVLFATIMVALINIFFYKAPIGVISTMLEFEAVPRYDRIVKLINLVLIALIVGAVILLWNKCRQVFSGALKVILLAVVTVSLVYAARMQKSLSMVADMGDSFEDDDPGFTLSRKGQNVIIIFIDRGISGYLPFFMEEKPELKAQLEGFTYYPNTVSFGACTMFGGPPLCGGYEYTPVEMNRRSDKSLMEKHNEALKLLPAIFTDAGYKVTVTDLPPGNYNAVNDMTVFDDIPGISAQNLIGVLPAGYDMNEYREKRRRNLFFYGFSKSAPAMLQDEIYDDGIYLAADREYMVGWQGFRDAYTVLENMTNLTDVTDDDENTFLFMYNNTPHEPTLLNLPEYDVNGMPDYTGIDIAEDKHAGGRTLIFDRDDIQMSVGHYHSGMATALQLGRWFDYLREQGVWDNSRIIIVSDHGIGLGQFEDIDFYDKVDVEALNPILMVKDFEQKEFKIDDTFMTQADTPSLAMQGIIGDPKNPFTGNPINMDAKSDGVIIMHSDEAYLDKEAVSWTDKEWYHVEDSIFNYDNWVEIDEADIYDR